MSAAERLDNFFKLLLGASLAFFACHYLWGVEEAADAGMIAGLSWVIFRFWSWRLKSNAIANST
ncbi:hypothetical protein [Aurantiacibacter zhengii]|uniref:Uncharacterized protein n=1 Tax=Aurantiacibacter zhengii TaxID=2307003 RepID=A0A418NTG6_9SPHN|nr:hypothetical protein [Aurantiacibacter zhengii]RIV86792.1 hypothetical protein D2V07_08885 [Aurantiacibacter zhengii]